MELALLLREDAILPSLKAGSKKQVLQLLAAKASALSGIPEHAVFDVLNEREKLGSTGAGNGVAIPHGRFPELQKIIGLFARMEQPVDFGAVDDHPVDLLFVLLAPEEAGADHLKALAVISRLLRDKDVREKLRATQSAEALYAILTDGEAG